jgi:LPXTG-motif cell wall-anchored protein
MTKLKPSNIFDYFAPTGNSTKIADFGISKKAIPVESIPTSNLVVPELPDGSKKNNTWLYILAGAALVIGGIYFINYKKRKDEEKI